MFTHTMTRKEIYEEAKHDYYELKSRFDIETEIFFGNTEAASTNISKEY